jgi:hypothetical protein
VRYTVLAALAILGTLIDATASWYSIEHLGIAAEGNPILDSVASTVGFTATMAIRAVIGVALIAALYGFATRSKRPQARKLARAGLWLSAIVLDALAVYHVVGILLYG